MMKPFLLLERVHVDVNNNGFRKLAELFLNLGHHAFLVSQKDTPPENGAVSLILMKDHFFLPIGLPQLGLAVVVENGVEVSWSKPF